MKRLSIVCVFLMVIFLPCVTFAVDCPIPDTGQTKCYNTITSIPCPSPGEPFYGQDANYVPCNPHSYTTLGGGIMVQDNVTGLIWEVKTDNVTPDIHDKDDTYTWQEAQDVFIAALNTAAFGGHIDWRLPTVKELSTLVDSSISFPGPSINTTFFPNTVSSHYWSSTTYAYDPSYAWLVHFLVGTVYGHGKSYGYYVRAVRSGQCGSFGDFVNNGDGTVTDNSTGLMWEVKESKDGTPDYENPHDADNTYTWEEALSLCEDLSFADYDDWRLPNRNELQSLVDYSQNPSIDTTFFPNTVSSYYWSSTTLADDPGYAWLVWFGYGTVFLDDKFYDVYVRAVRSGQCGSFPIPTLTEWGMIIFMTIIMGVGVVVLYRRRIV